MAKSQVVLIPCASYEPEEVDRAVEAGIGRLGGWQRFVRPDERILLKPNLVRDAEVDRAVITHPHVVQAVAKSLKRSGCAQLFCGDSCGVGSARKIITERGIFEGENPFGVRLLDFSAGETVQYEEGGRKESFHIARDVLESDALISISKMKTHALEHITGAVKNQYGCICGLSKAKGHTRYPDPDSFAKMLIRLNQVLAPRLYIMDGVVAMEGNGPASGDPTPMRMLLFSDDAVALDTLFASLIDLDPRMVPTIVHGSRMHFGIMDPDQIEVLLPGETVSVAEAVRRFGNPEFDVERSRTPGRGLLGKLGFLRIFRKKPYIEHSRCKKCGVCVKACPVEGKALSFANGRGEPPVYRYQKCIRCYCCQEMCPYKAIKVR